MCALDTEEIRQFVERSQRTCYKHHKQLLNVDASKCATYQKATGQREMIHIVLSMIETCMHFLTRECTVGHVQSIDSLYLIDFIANKINFLVQLALQ